MSDDLLDNIRSSIIEMQAQMQSTYTNLSDLKVTGESLDKTVRITMTATYSFEDIDFDERALAGGIREFKWRVREAWNDLSKKIQETTQAKTMELLQGMQIPDEIKSISTPNDSTDKK